MIRKFEIEDIKEVMNIWLETNAKAHPFIDKKYWVRNEEKVKKAILDAEVYVYEEEKLIVGFVGLVENYIAGIFVKESKQNEGIGKQLIEECKRHYPKLTLKVYEKNENAIRFYQRENFKIVSRKIDDDTKELELLMEWNKK